MDPIYTVSEKRKRVWEKELELYDIFRSICDENELRYFVICGSLLGAVRHQGFIPWDDDMDVAMPRADFDRFVALAQKSDRFRYPYFFQSHETEDSYVLGNVRIRNSATTAITQRGIDSGFSFNQGIWFSIFPYDNVPDDEAELESFRKQVYFFKTAIHNGCYGSFSRGKSLKANLMTLFGKAVIAVFGKTRACENYTKLVSRYSHENTKRFCSVATSSFSSRKKIFRKEWYDTLIDAPFENRTVPIPENYDEVLNVLYSDWKTPKRLTTTHGSTYFDPDRPYTYYLENGRKKELEQPFLD